MGTELLGDNTLDTRGDTYVYAWGQGLREGGIGRGAIQWLPRPISFFDSTGDDAAGISASMRRAQVWTAKGSGYIWRQEDRGTVEWREVGLGIGLASGLELGLRTQGVA